MRRIVALTVILAVFASVARSQDNASVIVNVTRFPENARQLPASVTVITADDIAASSAKTLPDLLAKQVGITVKDFFGSNGATTGVDLRGFGITGAQNTLILVDGQRVTDIDLSSVQWSAVPLLLHASTG